MIKLKSLITEIVRQMMGDVNESYNLIETESLGATLIWLEKDGTVYDTDEIQHGFYIADNPGRFDISHNFVQKVLKKFGEEYDDASAALCEEAFKRGWMRVVKVPWNKKIFVEGNEPTKAQKQVLENWFFEDKSWNIIWQRWVSSKFGPPRPIALFSPENI